MRAKNNKKENTAVIGHFGCMKGSEEKFRGLSKI